MSQATVELLSPAKNLQCGIAALNHGANAVYIGPPAFGARVAAANSLADIDSLVSYAHRLGSKVYVTLNTLLSDSELEAARRLVIELYQTGVDAILIQDFSLLALDLPPIALHASTQTDNRSPEKVRLLSELGFSRVVLARELSLSQIQEIHQACNVELEVFVHGALCVSYSGQCYMSENACGRSANRGSCAQFCRLPYNLTNARGRTLLSNKHLLSLPDMDRSASLASLLQAGVVSFKIEGRLKDVDYVKNVTAVYRKQLDALLGSSRCEFDFYPNVKKTFYRGGTSYFLEGHRDAPATTPGSISHLDTPKSVGECLGRVREIGPSFVQVDTALPLSNGDGLCFIDKTGTFDGFQVNRAEPFAQGYRLYPASREVLSRLDRQCLLYRNFDAAFNKQLNNPNSGICRIPLTLTLRESDQGFDLEFCTDRGLSVSVNASCEKTPARQETVALENLQQNLAKWGGTAYKLQSLNLVWSQVYFIPASLVALWRREGAQLLDRALACVREQEREDRKRFVLQKPFKGNPSQDLCELFRTVLEKEGKLSDGRLNYLANISNTQALAFYSQFGLSTPQSLVPQPADNLPLMRCKYCLRWEMGACLKQGGSKIWEEPLYIQSADNRFRLDFDCARCEMLIYQG